MSYTDELLKAHYIPGMMSGPIDLTISLISGFELFNTRPYHNHETFSNGWVIKDRDDIVHVREEYFDMAIKQFFLQYTLRKVKCLKKKLIRLGAYLVVCKHVSFDDGKAHYYTDIRNSETSLIIDQQVIDKIVVADKVFVKFGDSYYYIKDTFDTFNYKRGWAISRSIITHLAKLEPNTKFMIIKNLLGSLPGEITLEDIETFNF